MDKKNLIAPALVLLVVLGISSIAMASAGLPFDDRDNSGDSATEQVVASTGSAKPAPGVTEGSEWGVLTYQSKTDKTCVVAGPIVDGKVGAFSKEGFQAFQAEDAPGNCGDTDADIVANGGVAYATQRWKNSAGEKLSTVVYGLTGKDTTKVLVKVGSAEPLEAQLTPVESVEGAAASAFVAPVAEVANQGEKTSVDSLTKLVVTFVDAQGDTSSLSFY